MKRQLCRSSLLCIWIMVPFVLLCNSVLGSAPSLFSCARSDALAHYSSDRFIQRTILVVLHVRLSLVVSSPANSVDMFQQHPSVSIMRTFKQQNKTAKYVALSNPRPLQNICMKQIRGTFWICGTDQNKQRVKGESFHLCKLQMESKQLRLIL